MVLESPSLYRAPTVEEAWDDEADYTPLGNRSPAANVAAKRSRPEFEGAKDTIKANGSMPNKPGTAAVKEKNVQDAKNLMKQMAGLSIDTSVPDRQSRPYTSGPSEPRAQIPRAQESRASETRPAPEPRPQSTTGHKTRRQSSKTEKPQVTAFKHEPPGTCWVCDKHGSHVFNPPEPPRPSNDVVPYGVSPGGYQLAIATRPSKSGKSRSSNGRPPSIVGVPDGYPISAHPMTAPPGWQIPGTPMGYPDPYQVPASAYPYYPGQGYPQPFPSSYGQQALLEAGPSSESINGLSGSNPKSSYFEGHSPLMRKSSKTSTEYSRDASRLKAEDKKRMPPPPGGPLQRRESSTRTTARGKPTARPVSVFSPMSTSPYGRTDPPSSFREFPSTGHSDRPALKSSTTYDPITSLRGGGPQLERRTTAPRVERNEKEAELYQNSRSSRAFDLPTDFLGQFPLQSDEGSQRSFNSGSRGSSGGKTKTQATDFTVTYKDSKLSVSGPGAQKVKVLPGPNGVFSIHSAEGPRRTSSSSSWSKPNPAEDNKDEWGWDAGPSGSFSNDVDWGTDIKAKANGGFDDWNSKSKPVDERGGRGKAADQGWKDTSRPLQSSGWDEIWDPGPNRSVRDRGEPDRARKTSRDRGREKGIDGRDNDRNYDPGWPNSNRPAKQDSRGKPSAPDFWDKSRGGPDDWGNDRGRDEPKRWEDNTPKGRGVKNSSDWGDDSSKGWEDTKPSNNKNWAAEDKSWGASASKGWGNEAKERNRDEPKGWGNDSRRGKGGDGGWGNTGGGGGRGGGVTNLADEW